MKGSVFPEPAELLVVPEEVALELTEVGADWDSVGEPLDVLEVVVEVPVPLALVLWWGWALSGSTY